MRKNRSGKDANEEVAYLVKMKEERQKKTAKQNILCCDNISERTWKARDSSGYRGNKEYFPYFLTLAYWISISCGKWLVQVLFRHWKQYGKRAVKQRGTKGRRKSTWTKLWTKIYDDGIIIIIFWYSVKTVWGLSLVCGTIHIHNTYIQMFIEEEVSAVYIIPLVHGIISNQFSPNSWHNFKPIHKYNMQLFDYNYGINQTEITAGHMNMISRLLIKCSVIH